MPRLTPPVVPSGSLGRSEQPEISVDVSVRLRPWASYDAVAVRSAFADPDIQRWHLMRMDSEIEADEWIARARSSWREESVGSWVIGAQDSSEVFGRISLYLKDLRTGIGEVTYWVLPDARGSQLASRAASALSEWAFDVAGLHRIELLHSALNPASCRVAERAGFLVEGTSRSALLHVDGWHDMHVHSRLASDPR